MTENKSKYSVEIFEQPVIDLLSGDVVGAERTAEVSRGGVVVKAALDRLNGLKPAYRLWAVAVTQIILRSLPKDRLTLVNVPSGLLADRGFIDNLLSSIEPAYPLALELVEKGLPIYQQKPILEGIERLRSRGIGIFLDDVPSGANRIEYVEALSNRGVGIDGIKVDLRSCGVNRAIGLVKWAWDQGIPMVVVEKVQTPEESDSLGELLAKGNLAGVLGQGYLYGMPEVFGKSVEMSKAT